jgi:Na+/proline symporter
MFLNTATHGTDQLLVQRLLAARNMRDSQKALLSSGLLVLMQFILFLMMGAALWVFYHARPFPKTDYIFPTFIMDHMPRGICGLLIAAILAAAMSNLSAALNSLSSTSTVDFYLRARPATSDQKRLALSRSATIVWGIVLFGLALASRYGGSVLEKASA